MEKQIKSICAIVVTYNRKELLLRCIRELLKQTYPLNSILIIDNASTDQTFETLCEYFNSTETVKSEQIITLSQPIQKTKILIYRTSKNIGGAGGFHTGIKIAKSMNIFQAYWLMDDDGYPNPSCLETLLPYIDQYNYVMPVSIDIEDHAKLSWASKLKDKKKKTIFYNELKKSWGDIMYYVYPFNGCLFNNHLIDIAGNIKKELFIWGDDYEHYFRCLKKGITPITITKAEFYHPANKIQTHPILLNKIQIPYVESKLRFICLIRNWTYIYKENNKYFHILRSFIAYSWLFIITRKCDLKGYKLYIKAFYDGLTNNFTRHFKYLN